MIVWMLSSVAAAALLGLAARLAEPAFQARRRPVRWVWAAALVAAVALPARALVGPAPADAPVAMPSDGVPAALLLLDQALASAGPTWTQRTEPFLPAAWAIFSVLTAVVLLGGLARLTLQARRWPRSELAGVPVLVSGRFGPAVLGVVRPRIVVPRWVLDLDPHRRRLVLLHEEEHRRAGDAPLLALGALAVVATPWNPVCWWLLHRLRGAVEMDCDARVLARGVDVPAYGRLLLDLGTRVEGAALAVAAFAKPKSLLERRLTTMVRGERGTRTRGALALLAGVALVALACETPVNVAGPDESEASAALIEDAEERAAASTLNDPPVASGGRVVGEGDEPLIYVDGTLLAEGLGDLQPEDIARVEVIKGDEAVRLFGAEAARGVIQIYTKEGEGEKPTITLRPVTVMKVGERSGSGGTIRERHPGATGEFRFGPASDGTIRKRQPGAAGEFRFEPGSDDPAGPADETVRHAPAASGAGGTIRQLPKRPGG